MIWASGWAWFIAAVVLGIAETILPGFILLGFGIGALLTAGLLAVGLVASLGPVLMVFALGSLAGWVGLRLAFRVKGDRPKIWTRDINEN